MVYLLHLSRPLSHASHYLGSADDLAARLDRHARGNGAKLLRACREQGISWQLVRTWEGGRDVERALKRQHSGKRLCPICKLEGSL